MEQRISLITLAVSDMTRSANFYEALGWTRTPSSDGVIAFDLLSQTLGLYPKAGLAEDLGIDVSDIGGFSGMTLGQNVREKSDVAEILNRVEAAGGRVVKPEQDVFWGGHHGYFADPDGYIWEIAHNPFSPLSEDGAFRWSGFGADNA